MRGWFKALGRHSLAFPLAIVVVVMMLLISEAAAWRSARALQQLTQTSTARTVIQSLGQGILAAQTAQRGYLLTGQRPYLAAYQSALQEIASSFLFMNSRYLADPNDSAIVVQLQTLTDALLRQLAHTMAEHTAGHRTDLDARDETQQTSIRALTEALMAREVAHASESQSDVDCTLQFSRFSMALLSAVSLVALFMTLLQHLALQRQRHAVQRMVQSERDRLERVVRQRTAQLTDLTQHLQTAREDERNRLARDLHDDLGALLTAAKLDAARIRSRLLRLESAQEPLELLAHLVATLNSGITLGRRIIEDLRPSTLGTLGLASTLEILAAEYAANSGLQVHRHFEPVVLDSNAELMIYRLIQEALTNISKHAKAQAVWIQMGRADGQVEVSVRDDGVGFDTAVQPPSAYGLVGMRFRVQAQGGSLQVIAAPGHGTLIRVRLPESNPDQSQDAVV